MTTYSLLSISYDNILIYQFNGLNLDMKPNKQIFSFLFSLFFLLFGFAINGNSQIDNARGVIVAFHPSVGNSINLSEKKELELFTEYNDSLFESAQLVKYSSESYTILFKSTKNESFEKAISIKELDEIYSKIEHSKPATKTLATADNTERELSKEEQEKIKKKEEHYESIQTIAEITFQIIFVLLEILAQN